MANFKETKNYLDIMNYAFEEYKASLKRVDPNFDAEYYDDLILQQALGELQTPITEDLVGFDHLDPIGTLGNTVDPSVVNQNADASSSQVGDQLAS